VKRLAIVLMLVATLFASTSEKKKKPLPDYAVISGTVFTGQGRLARGVKLTIRKADEKKPRWELMSDDRGEFSQRVPAGAADYVVRPELKDKQAAEKAEVKVHVDNDEQQSVTLHLTEQEQTKK
jgi:hypothetical protein